MKTERWLPGHCRKLNSLVTFLDVGHQRALCHRWTLFLRNVSCWDGWSSSRVLFFFFLTAPSSWVTLFSYLPSIKGFLMTRVNPEHKECCVGLKIKRPGFTWISSHSPLLWDEHFSRYHKQIKDAPGAHLRVCVFSVNVKAGWRLEIKGGGGRLQT